MLEWRRLRSHRSVSPQHPWAPAETSACFPSFLDASSYFVISLQDRMEWFLAPSLHHQLYCTTHRTRSPSGPESHPQQRRGEEDSPRAYIASAVTHLGWRCYVSRKLTSSIALLHHYYGHLQEGKSFISFSRGHYMMQPYLFCKIIISKKQK